MGRTGPLPKLLVNKEAVARHVRKDLAYKMRADFLPALSTMNEQLIDAALLSMKKNRKVTVTGDDIQDAFDVMAGLK